MADWAASGLRGVHRAQRIVIELEPLSAENFELVAGWLSTPDVNQWLSSDWRGRAIDPSLIAIAVRNKRNRFFLVRADGTACGLVALSDLDTVDRIAMVWYVLGDRASGGKGVTTAAVAMLAQIAFDTLDLEAINAWIIDGNEASRRVLLKNGFRETGRLRNAAAADGLRVDRVYFDLTRDEHQQRGNALP
jgi:RimJ/RimL family protein N-acetyltransferase